MKMGRPTRAPGKKIVKFSLSITEDARDRLIEMAWRR